MKFVETQFTNKTEILKFPDHYVALAVTVDDTGIIANAYGKKIVPAGTIVGGSTKSNLQYENEPVADKYSPVAVAANLTTGTTGSKNAILWTAVEAGLTGNEISVALIDPSGVSKTLVVTVSGKDISVSLATDDSGTITSTSAEVSAAINADADAKLLVLTSVDLTCNDNGSGKVTAKAKTTLSGGDVGAATNAEGVLLNDVDVTYGPKEGAMIIHGFVSVDKMPYGNANADAGRIASKVLSMIKFIK